MSSSGSGSGPPGHHNHHQQQARTNEPTNQRFSNLIHDSEVFLTKLREFKPQSLGCLEARRKSSSTLIFPSPQQACMGPPKCPRYPHNVKPTPGYWIECHGPGVMATGTSGSGARASSSQQQQQHAGSSSVTDDIFHSELDDQATNSASSAQPVSPIGYAIKTSSAFDKELVQDHPGRQSTSVAGTGATGSTGHTGTGKDKIGAGSRRRQSQDRGDGLVASTSLQQLADQMDYCVVSIEAEQVARATKETTRTGGSRQATASSSSGSMRKKMNKRTMTRDDIDLHKSRRGTPNITITEPSFNHSTTSPFSNCSGDNCAPATGGGQPQVGAGSPQPLNRQRSGPSSSSRSTFDDEPQSPDIDKRQPIKFQIQRYASIEQQRASGGSSHSIERQESCDSGELSPLTADQPTNQRHHHHRPQQQQEQQQQQQQQQQQSHHRPSIIREDIDDENETNLGADGGRPQQKELYCGLSTREYTKRSCHQASGHHQDQQQPGGESQTQDAQQHQQQHQLHQFQHQHQRQECFEQFRDSSLELISFEEENYEKHYYGREHWNYFTNDELLGPVMLSLKQEVNNQRDHFHVLLRTVSYTLHGTIPASTICADRYDREAIVRELSEIAKLKPPLMLGQLPSTPDELLKLDHIFIKTELKVGVIYIKQGQEESEESILGNKEESPLFTEFLDLLGDRITLKGFDRYKGGLDTVHNLTGTESVYTMWRNIEIMFHVSTMLPHEENDPQKLQKKRHIGNDIVCVAFIESDDTLFWPGCIKSYFLHTFIAVRTSPKPLKEGESRKYSVSCVCRNEVQYAFRPYLVEQDQFYKSDYFREWLLVKIVNGERASYSAPKFARMQDRTRSQLLEDIITNLANHLVTGQIPKPYRRGSWRPLGHTRASSPLEDSMKDYFEDYDQLAKDFQNAFCGPNKSVLCDVAFKVKDADGSYKLVHGVRAILAIRSRTFLEMLYGFVPPGASSTGLQNQTNLRAIEMKALSGESASSAGAKEPGEQHTKNLLTKRGSVGTDPSRKIGEKERRQSMLPNLSKSVSQKANYLTVPSAATGGGGGTGGGAAGSGSGAGAGGMIKNAFNRLVSGNWSGWSGNIKSYKGEPMHIKVDQNKTKVDLNSLAICKEIAKIDSDKLAQTEFEIKEFDYETFQQTIEYIHNGQCKLSYETIPGLICAAEHYDLPDLLHACFHHANTHMRLSAAPQMMNLLYQNSCFYITAMQLLDSIYEYIDPHGNEFFSRTEYLDLYESVFTSLLCRKTLQVSELRKFQAMDGWARRQVANKLQQQAKQLLQRKQSTEQEQRQQQLAGISGSLDQHQTPTCEHQTVVPLTSTPITTTMMVHHDQQQQQANEQFEHQEYKNLMLRLNKDINIKLDKISNEELVKVVLPTKVFSNEKMFEVMADESRLDY